MDTSTILESVGMTKDQARIYISLLEMGAISLPVLSKKVRISTAKLLDIIELMKEHGWISEVFYENQKLYHPLDPNLLLIDFKKSLRRLSDYVPYLMGIYNKRPFHPKIYFFEGIEGIKEVYNETLLVENYDLFAYVKIHKPDDRLYDFLMDHIARRKQKNIKAYVIAPKSPEAQVYKSRDSYDLRETLLVNEPWFELELEIQIYPNKVSICSFGEEYVGMIIESKAAYTSFKNIFHFMWNTLKHDLR